MNIDLNKKYPTGYTAVEFQPWNMDRIDLIGFCTEEPKEVLSRVFQKYIVHKYKGLWCPIDSEAANEENEFADRVGLVIGNTTLAPKGTKVVGLIEDLDLSTARISRIHRGYMYTSPTPQKYKHTLKESLGNCFTGDISGMSPLGREARLEYETAMQEVAEVTLGITGMPFEKLRRFLMEETK